MKIAVLGLGLMGAAIALRLKGQGFDIVGWNRSSEKTRALAGEGLETAGSAREAIDRAEVLILVLSDAAAIAETLFAPGTAAGIEGRVVLQMGTIGPTESRNIARRVDVAMIATIEAACARALGQGYGDQDYSALYEAMAPRQGSR